MMGMTNRCAVCGALDPAHYPACTTERAWRVDGPLGYRPRTYRSLESAYGQALTIATQGPIGTHVVITHKRTGPFLILDRIPAKRVLVKMLP